MSKPVIAIIVVAILLVVCCVVSVLGISYFRNDYNNYQNKVDSQYQSCMTTAYNNYTEGWNNACKSNDLPDGCNLPILVSNAQDARYAQDQALCK